ncbi:J domain-containing protein [Azonexus sp.]|uniref:J domain-containing protein n=1 Tax=Azonexus sp. TaxID=1872668 RepID=UPI0027B8ECD3|nr:J domain-containing protein [Azonexus sp.]
MSEAQQTFNTLSRKIEQQRAQLAAWETAIGQFRQKYVHELLPLFEQSLALRRALILALDEAVAHWDLTGREVKTVDALIVSLAEGLSDEEAGDAQPAIARRHGEAAAQLAPQSAALSGPPNLDEASEADLLQQIQAQVDAMQAELDAQAAARAAKRSGRQKTLRQQARASRDALETKQASLSVREVYRKLVSVLHPDRAANPDEALRKTVLMQQANEAYEKNDLLQLLALQLAVEQIDQTALLNIGESRLEHYNRVLVEQLAELTREIRHVEAEFRRQFGIPSSTGLAPGKLLRLLTKDVVTMQQVVFQYKNDLLVCASADKLKAWLRQFQPGQYMAL